MKPLRLFFALPVFLALAACFINPKEVKYIYLPDPDDYASTNGDTWVNPSSTYTNLAWSDEFNGTSLDTANWVYDLGIGPNSDGWGNSEWEVYTSNSANQYFTNGTLLFRARRNFNSSGGYTSMRIKTLGKRHFKYGMIAARIRLPYSQGIWPAFWMMGTNGQTWPRCGEIDIMEMIGGGAGRDDTVYGNLFWYDENASTNLSHNGFTNVQGGANLCDAFHVYAVEWSPGQIKWYFDQTNFMTRTITSNVQTELSNQHFYILLNVAVGGIWPQYPTGTEPYPQRMWVDWVRVYQE